MADAAGSANFTYNSHGNRTAESRIISGVTYNTSYAYDLANDLTEITYPSGLIVDYSRDSLSRVSGVTMKANALASPVSLASNIQYLPFGPMQSLTLGNGLIRSFQYDQDYRRTKIVTDDGAGGNGRQNLTLSYDGTDNITGIADALDGSRSQTLTYDLLAHLKQATGAYGSDSFNYDANGNRSSRTLINGTPRAAPTHCFLSYYCSVKLVAGPRNQ